MINAISQFFLQDLVLPHFNSNTIVLIPKSIEDDNINQFRPLAMTNFKHKIITKIHADRLSAILPSLISPEKRALSMVET